MEGNRDNKGLWIAIVGALATIVVAAIEFKPWQKEEQKPTEEKNISKGQTNENRVTGTVVEDVSNNSIGQAQITVVGRNKHYFSEADGNFHITIDDATVKEIRIRVTKTGYVPYDKTFDLPSEGVIIKLNKLN